MQIIYTVFNVQFTLNIVQAGLMGQGQFYEVKQGQMLGPALQSQEPHAMLQAWGGVTGKLPSAKGPWGVG